jgi:AraC-like DNA-binding protein
MITLNPLDPQKSREPESVADGSSAPGGPVMVRIDALLKFTEVVTRLGGDPQALLAKVRINPASLNNRHAVIPYRSVVLLLEHAAVELGRPDFGMHFAAAQSGIKILGPLEFVLCNSRTVREAFRYGTEHPQVYSTAAHTRFEEGCAGDGVFLRFEVRLPKLPDHLQAIERALLLTQNCALYISEGRVRPREIWFTHQPLSPLSTYREYFGTPVRFGQSMNGLVFTNHDLDLPIANVDPQVHELATDFIERRYPRSDSILSTRVRSIVERLLLAGNCTYAGAASSLGMHPRTLQRRLRAEGESFETIKDGVRRDIALRYLKQPSIPLIRVAGMLGYSESGLVRSCYRWFSASPRQIRSGEAADGLAESP